MPFFAYSEKAKILFGWKTSSGFLLREFGDKDIHPQYRGDVKNGKPNGMGIMSYPSGKRFLGEWKNGKKAMSVVKHAHDRWKERMPYGNV